MISLTNVLLSIFAVSALIYLYFTRNFNYWAKRGVPHKKPIFLFGNALDIMLTNISPGKCVAQLYNEFKGEPYIGFFAVDKPFLILKDPNIIKQIMIKNFNVFRDRFFYMNENIDPIMSNTLFGIKAPHWKILRNKLSPVFTSGKVKAMMPLMKVCGENLEKHIKGIVGESVGTKELTGKYSTDVIVSCALGIDANSFLEENSEFRIAGRKLFSSTGARSVQALAYLFAHFMVRIFRFKFMDTDAVKFLKRILLETIKQREESNAKRQDLIDILIELKNHETKDDEYKFNDDRLVAQVVAFFGAGQETTSSTIAFTLHEICINPEIQERLRKEILDCIQKHNGLTYEAIQDMKYLDMVVSETLRKYPLTAFLQREASEDCKIDETGLLIEKGIGIIIPQHGLHWDPKYFPEPQKYDPERFSDENKHNINPYVYLPFGNGPRNCIGERFGLLSSKLGIISVVKNYRVERSPKTVDPLVLNSAALTQAEGGIPLIFRPIS